MKNTLSLRSFARLTLSALLGAVLAVVMALGQENTGSVQGVVKDPTGAAIPGAEVILSGPALVRSLEATSDKEGAYIFPKVPAGIYTVTVSQPGFKTVKNEDVKVILGQASKVDVALSAGGVTESVTVTPVPKRSTLPRARPLPTSPRNLLKTRRRAGTSTPSLSWPLAYAPNPRPVTSASVVSRSTARAARKTPSSLTALKFPTFAVARSETTTRSRSHSSAKSRSRPPASKPNTRARWAA